MSSQYEEHALLEHDPDRLLVAMDSSDGVVQAPGSAAIIEAYKRVVGRGARSQQLVMGLETGCVPGFCVKIPAVQTPALPGNYHVNGGFVMGPARLMYQMWHDVATTNVSCCHNGRMHPQLGMGNFALRHPELVTFDVQQRLIAIINLRDSNELPTNYQVEGGYVRNRNTGMRPAFLHFPGQQFPAAWQTYRDLVLQPRGLLSARFVSTIKVQRKLTAVKLTHEPRSVDARSHEKPRPKHTAGLAGWPSVRAQVCTNIKERVIFMLTSTPHRAARMERVLENMRAQSRRPDAVILTIPKTYARPPLSSLQYRLEQAIADDSLLQVHRIDQDAGPLTKYFGGLALGRNSNDIVVVGDDDVWYDSTFIEDFACAVASGAPNVVYSSGRDTSCGTALGACVMGFRGISMRASMLLAIPSLSIPKECFLADDVLVTHHFQSRGFTIKKLRTRRRYHIDAAFAWSNASINVIHKQHNYEINRKCVEQLIPRNPD